MAYKIKAKLLIDWKVTLPDQNDNFSFRHTWR
jgi:hypothetical protein